MENETYSQTYNLSVMIMIPTFSTSLLVGGRTTKELEYSKPLTNLTVNILS